MYTLSPRTRAFRTQLAANTLIYTSNAKRSVVKLVLI